MASGETRHFGIPFKNFPSGRAWDELDASNILFLHPEIAQRSDSEMVKRMRKVDWFWFIVNLLWGKGAPKVFIRHPWAEEMAEAACYYKSVSFSGCASSGKTDFGAVWGLVNWQAAPIETKILVTSTSLKEARKRIWGSIREYFMGSAIDLPGKLLDSLGQIRVSEDGKGSIGSDKSGIELIASEQSQEKEAVGRLIGIKNSRVILIADELPELTQGILSARANLASNPYFQLVAMGNFKSLSDPFGILTEPANGWASVNVNTGRWKTKEGGCCIRFDGSKSPNLLQPHDKWPIYGHAIYEEHKKLGENSIQFWRMCRSFPAPAGVADHVYSDMELVDSGAFGAPLWGAKRRIQLAALDAAFTSGGDRSAAIFGWMGWDSLDKQILHIESVLTLREDVTASKPYDYQIAALYKAECDKRGIPPFQAAYDATGSGISFGTLLGEIWNPQVLGVKFGGAASETWSESAGTMKLANQLYANRVSELWYQGKEYFRRKQIFGLPSDVAEELTARKYDIQKGAETKIIVESKRDMKSRISKSPDFADAFFILLELARTRFAFVPHGQPRPWEEDETVETPSEEADQVYSEDSILEDSYA